ncbi:MULTISPECIES: hypothetical protein [Enterobacterales]|uniref:hypothetical protein n=1 Tax=Enterobacterales TaxID=91347 RepID=UPI000B61C241|nr:MULTISPECIES: hypothetical protein [Enterobacterales]ASM03159.1 hypothetical protein BVG88_13715 [Serratia marcescens]MBH2553462.1 hypothetical protein [Serratia ureilytica]MCZ9588237.1 hypothetical protein [Klebsiella pneumoniae]
MIRTRTIPGTVVPGAVLYPCLAAAALVLFTGIENLMWRTGVSYPAVFAQVRYVDDVSLLTPQALMDICGLPLTKPELKRKQNGLYLRCGTPVLEGVYRIEHYKD